MWLGHKYFINWAQSTERCSVMCYFTLRMVTSLDEINGKLFNIDNICTFSSLSLRMFVSFPCSESFNEFKQSARYATAANHLMSFKCFFRGESTSRRNRCTSSLNSNRRVRTFLHDSQWTSVCSNKRWCSDHISPQGLAKSQEFFNKINNCYNLTQKWCMLCPLGFWSHFFKSAD